MQMEHDNCLETIFFCTPELNPVKCSVMLARANAPAIQFQRAYYSLMIAFNITSCHSILSWKKKEQLNNKTIELNKR